LPGRDYHHSRLHSPTVKHSLEERIRAVRGCIKGLGVAQRIQTWLDIGSADGLLAQGIQACIPGPVHVYALDMDKQMLTYNPFFAIKADCTRLPFLDESFDLITAAAVIEHLAQPQGFLHECCRVLNPGGLLVLTCPAPFFDWLATKIGYLKDAGHLARYSLKDLRRMCAVSGFEAAVSKRFMISPVRFPGDMRLEAVFSKIGFDICMLNQVVAAFKR
jgi:ubiquinone/menaquinone biosynthesis C-methylase UbiE